MFRLFTRSVLGWIQGREKVGQKGIHRTASLDLMLYLDCCHASISVRLCVCPVVTLSWSLCFAADTCITWISTILRVVSARYSKGWIKGGARAPHVMKSSFCPNEREKGRDLTQSCDKNPYTHRTIQKVTWQHKNATKNFDYTTIADRLRTVSWSNNSHPTGVVRPVYERSTFPLIAKVV